MTAWARDEILKLLHPFMPFITEELWRGDGGGGPARDEPARALALAELERLADGEAKAEINWVIDLVTKIRSVRAEMNVAGGDAAGAGRWARAKPGAASHLRRGSSGGSRGVSDIGTADKAPPASAQIITADALAPAAAGHHRFRRREGAAREGDGAGQIGHRPHRRQARQCRLRRARAGGGGRRRAREARGGRDAAAKIDEALERLKGAA